MEYKHGGEQVKLIKVVSWIQLTECGYHWSNHMVTVHTFLLCLCLWLVLRFASLAGEII